MNDARLTQYTVEFPNDPAIQESLTRLLLQEEIDIRSMIAVQDGSRTVVRFRAAKNDALRDRLAAASLIVRQEPCARDNAPAKPAAGLRAAYGVVEDGKMRLVLAVEDESDVDAVFGALGYKTD